MTQILCIIARFHNILGPQGGGAGMIEERKYRLHLSKIAQANTGDSIEIRGDGMQTRSFLFIDECLDGVLKLMNSDFMGLVNIGSDEMITINELALLTIEIAGKNFLSKICPVL